MSSPLPKSPLPRGTPEEVASRLASILASAPEAILTINHEGHIIEFNPAAEQLFGHKAETVLGRSMAEVIIPPSLRSAHAHGMARHMATGVSHVLGKRLELRALRANGSEFPCELSIVRLPLDGHPTFTAFFRDITERTENARLMKEKEAALEAKVAEQTQSLRRTVAELEQATQSLRLAQNVGKLGYVNIDRARGLRVWNPVMFDLFGFPYSEQPPPLSEMMSRVHPDDRPRVTAIIDRSYVTGELAGIIEYRLRLPDGRERWVRNLAQHYGNAKDCIMSIYLDITDIKAAEDELQRTLDRERELGRLKEDFLHMVTHEYRTPLGIIVSSAEILLDYHERLDKTQREEHLDQIRASALHMADLLEEVLFLGKSSSARFELEYATIPLQTWAEELAADVTTSLGEARNVNIIGERLEAQYRFDPRLLRHILTNLLSNALKYSEAPAPVSLALRDETESVIFEIRDKGIGIPEAEQRQLFEMFHRCSNVGAISGTGLGLAVVKRCVDLHQGTIQVESAPGQGTCFRVRLPKS